MNPLNHGFKSTNLAELQLAVKLIDKAVGEEAEVVLPPGAPSLQPLFYGLLAMFAGVGCEFVVYVRWFRPISPAISLRRLRRIVMRGSRAESAEASEVGVATILDQLRSSTDEVTTRPTAPLLEEFDHAVVWKPKSTKFQATPEGRKDVKLLKYSSCR